MANVQTSKQVSVTVEHIGGIDETSVEFSPGVTILEGRNATNRTSLLQAVMAACGSTNVSIKGDEDSARVELQVGDETYTRSLTRAGDTVTPSGDAILEDTTVAELFAFLLESNEARQAVARGDDLRELIMRPVDTDEIQSEIDRLLEERDELEREIEEIEDLKGDLPELESKKEGLEDRLEEKKAELAEKEAELEDLDRGLEESREEKAELEDTLEDLREKRSTLDDVRYDLETERETLEELTKERSQLEAELDDLPETPVGDIAELEAEIGTLREKKRELEAEINEIQSTIRFNENALEDTDRAIFHSLGDSRSDGGAVTDQLLEEDTITCWTCGSEVEAEQIESTLDQLRELSQQKVSEANGLGDEIDDLESQRKELQEHQRERERTEQRLTTVESQIEESEGRIETLQERRNELSEEIERLDDEVEEMDDGAYSDVLDVHKEANQLEYEIGRIESDLDRVKDNIATVEDRIAKQDDLKAELVSVEDELEELRTKIERIETEAIEAFNDQMETVLDLLDYDNLARIWLERKEREVREGRRKVQKSVFELHIVRQTDSGTAYEDTVDHLSESEREVTGLVFALAGYLVHDVHEQCPFILLDSLEAIDSNRIATLVDHFQEYSPYLVIALLPEDASALDDDYTHLTTN